MPNYRATVTVMQYRAFEFEADDDELAWDHIEHLANHHGPSYIADSWEESGYDEIHIDSVEEI